VRLAKHFMPSPIDPSKDRELDNDQLSPTHRDAPLQPLRRRRIATVLACAALAVAAGTFLVVTRQQPSARRRRSRSATSKHRNKRMAATADAPALGAAAAHHNQQQEPPQHAHHHHHQPQYDPRIAGSWIKDKAHSDPMDAAMDAMCVGGLKRRAIALVRGLELSFHDDAPGSDDGDDGSESESGGGGGTGAEAAGVVAAAAAAPQQHHQQHHHQHQTRFTFAVFSVLPLLKVREHYVLDGPPSSLRRRDLRGGGASGRARALEGPPNESNESDTGGKGALEVTIDWPPPHAGRGRDEIWVDGEDPDRLVVESLLTMEDPGVAPVRCRTVYRRVR